MRSIRQVAVDILDYDAAFRRTRARLDEFADKHPLFDELAPRVMAKVKAGYGLEDAYKLVLLDRINIILPYTMEEQMPSKSKAQRDFMRAVAHSPSFARKAGVSQKVGREFEAADEARGKRKLPMRTPKRK